MKKFLLLPLLAMLLIGGQHSSSQNAKISPAPTENKTFQVYTWYMDEDLEVPTGTISSISAELARLRNLYPANIFSSAFSIGLHEYEYGDSPYYFTVVIFSDR